MNALEMKEYGIDCADGLARCLNKEALYRRLLTMFLDDDSFFRAKAAYESRSNEALFKCAHELKGASGTAALTALSAASGALVEYLRGGGEAPERIAELFAELESAYGRAREGVALILAEEA